MPSFNRAERGAKAPLFHQSFHDEAQRNHGFFGLGWA